MIFGMDLVWALKILGSCDHYIEDDHDHYVEDVCICMLQFSLRRFVIPFSYLPVDNEKKGQAIKRFIFV